MRDGGGGGFGGSWMEVLRGWCWKAMVVIAVAMGATDPLMVEAEEPSRAAIMTSTAQQRPQCRGVHEESRVQNGSNGSG